MSETNASAARQEPRYNVEMTAFFEGFGTKPQEGKVVDVSNRGLYLEIEDLPTQNHSVHAGSTYRTEKKHSRWVSVSSA